MQKSKTALRRAHALPPVLLLLSPPTLPLRRRRTSPRTAGGSPAVKYTAWEKLRHVQLLDGKQSARSQAPSTFTIPNCLHAATSTPATRRQDTSRSPVFPPSESSRSHNPVRAFSAF
ncbi:exo-alpha-sialidase [Trypanosoma cruzi]|nr:exo-alpha-sialidase [Trypanosoma cruzi]